MAETTPAACDYVTRQEGCESLNENMRSDSFPPWSSVPSTLQGADGEFQALRSGWEGRRSEKEMTAHAKNHMLCNLRFLI